jgi:hypothetical protein
VIKIFLVATVMVEIEALLIGWMKISSNTQKNFVWQVKFFSCPI